MRDLVVTGLVVGLLPLILRWPHVGVLAYAWLSYMNPHRLTWGFAHGLPFAQVVMIATFIGLACSRERKLPWMSGPAWVLLLLTVWVTLTTFTAKVPDSAWPKWETVSKVMLVTFLTLALFRDPARLRQLVWVIALSIGFFGIKGGLFTLLTGGAHRVWGPPASFIEDNNALALALVMVTPLLYFLAATAGRAWVRAALYVALALNVIGIFGTYSRGGILALAGMAGFLWLHSRSRLATGALGLVLLLLGLVVMPGGWTERMSSIRDYQQDESVNARFRAWGFALDQAAERPLVGGGFRVFALNTQDKGANGEEALNAHSIYFEVLGEHGWVGLALFVAFLVGVLMSAGPIVRAARERPELGWAALLARCLQTGIIGYALGGAFLTLGFFDLFYHLAAVMLLTRLMVRDAAAEGAAALRPRAFTPARPDAIRRQAAGGTWAVAAGRSGRATG